MTNTTPQNITFNQSTLNDVQGNLYDFNGSSPGEYGIHKLFEASCPAAFLDSPTRYRSRLCPTGTRATILKEIFSWISTCHSKVLWLSGPMGTGKSAIAQTVAEACAKNLTLAASFFIFHREPGCDSSDHLVASIAYQIVIQIPEKRAELGGIIERDLSILHKPLQTQFQKLVVPLFSTTSDDVGAAESTSHPSTPFLVIIDGLDKCKNELSQRGIVKSIDILLKTPNIPLRFIIFSRPEPSIQEPFSRLAFQHMPLNAHLHDPSRYEGADEDIHTYLRCRFNRIFEEQNMVEEGLWPSDNDMEKLVRNSGKSFIYATTLIEYVGDRYFNPLDRLSEILDDSPESKPFSELDHLYRCILGAHKNTKFVLKVLAAVCFANGFLKPSAIEKLVGLGNGKVAVPSRQMHFIIGVQNLNFHHESFRDFIHNKERAGEYYMNVKKGHAVFARMLLRYMSKGYIYGDDIYFYAWTTWVNHFEYIGSWYENPWLLEDISSMLDSVEHGRISLANVINQPRVFSWFDVYGTKPVVADYNPLGIRDRLFKHAWKSVRKNTTLYRYSGTWELMGGRTAIGPTCDCRAHCTNCLNMKHRVADVVLCPAPDSKDTIHGLMRGRLQESQRLNTGCLSHGHAFVVDKCLLRYLRGLEGPRSLEAYSYAQTYWKKHLLEVPPKHPILLKSFQKYDRSISRHIYSPDEIQAIHAWLKSGKIKPEKYPLIERNGWFKPPGFANIFEREVQEVQPHYNSFGVAASYWL